MRIAIVVEAIPPYCGGGEQVAWIHATTMAERHEVSVVTFGSALSTTIRDGVALHTLPRMRRGLLAYRTTHIGMLKQCLNKIAPAVIHCHMPNVLSACLDKKNRLMVSTIHDGVPENEMRKLKFATSSAWYRFKLLRQINVHKSDLVTCVSRHNLEIMKQLYPTHAHKFVTIPNPVGDRFLEPVSGLDENYVLNFGRQIPLKMAALLDVAREMPGIRFVFVGTGEMVKDHGLSNVKFIGFSENVEHYIDRAALCVFPSLSENFPLVGLEAMARGKVVVATNRGFSEYINHMQNGFLLSSCEPSNIKRAIEMFMRRPDLRGVIGRQARLTAEGYRAANIIGRYEKLYHGARPTLKERRAIAGA